MSQDLFAAFGSEPAKPTADGNVLDVDDDDDFGDFEDASATVVHIAEVQPTNAVGLTKNSRSQAPDVRRHEAKSFPPKKSQTPGSSNVGSNHAASGGHPFAERMDTLFEAGHDDYDAGADELADLATNPEAAMAYSKRIIAEQEAALARKATVKSAPPEAAPAKALGRKIVSSHSRNASNSDSGPKKLRKKSGYVPAREPEVMFDAESLSEHDFGDIETDANGSKGGVTPIASVERSTPMPTIDLLGLDEPAGSGKSTNGKFSDEKLENAPSQPPSKSALQAQPWEQQDDDAWDDFEAAAPAIAPPTSNTSQHTRSVSRTRPPTSADSSGLLPPTPIPPPSVLLSLFPPLFSSADEVLFNTMAKLDLKQRQMLLAHPASHQFLKGYLNHCVVLAHIVAGRKLRWKRDQHFSQSMRIGPSAAGGKSGMKLAGVDKSELTKEDRGVVDTIDRWKLQVGKLRTAVTAASTAPGLPKLPSVPEILEQMPVRTLKQSEGGVSATHACALCGLRREERVAKVDVEVEDSFGEWWVQGMNMHLACKRFWDEFEKKLKSR